MCTSVFNLRLRYASVLFRTYSCPNGELKYPTNPSRRINNPAKTNNVIFKNVGILSSSSLVDYPNWSVYPRVFTSNHLGGHRLRIGQYWYFVSIEYSMKQRFIVGSYEVLQQDWICLQHLMVMQFDTAILMIHGFCTICFQFCEYVAGDRGKSTEWIIQLINIVV